MPSSAAAASALAGSRDASPATTSSLLFRMPGMTFLVAMRAVDSTPQRTGSICSPSVQCNVSFGHATHLGQYGDDKLMVFAFGRSGHGDGPDAPKAPHPD